MKLYLGDTSEDFSSYVLAQDPYAILGNDDNIEFLLSGNTNVYISLADINRLNFSKLCLDADQIVVYSQSWNDQNLKKETQTFVNTFFNNTANNFYTNLEQAMLLNAPRVSDKSQLWAVGCSFTSAVGVEYNQRWANHLSDTVQQPVSVLAHPGASISWARDQILRSDIRSGDTVVWLLTTMHRIDYYSELDHEVKVHPNLSVYKEDRDEINKLTTSEYKLLMQVIVLKWHVYTSFKAIKQVINYCNKLGIKLILGQALDNDAETDSALVSLLKDEPGFTLPFSVNLYYDNFMLDRGTDNLHPGPLTHKYIADEFYKTLCSLK